MTDFPTGMLDSDDLLTFDDIRAEAYRLLGDTQDVLRSDWRPGTGPSHRQADAVDTARRLIAQAKEALNRAGR